MTALRLALLGAFQFPAPQGSQAFAREQAEALTRAGVEVTFLSYGCEEPVPLPFETRRVSPNVAPHTYRSGFHPRKPLADLALARNLVALQRSRRFDAVLAHNVEAALVARLAHAFGGPPFVYIAHTLFEQELSAYIQHIDADRIARFGLHIDRAAAASTLGTLAVSEIAAERLRDTSPGPIAVLPPGVPITAACSTDDIAKACAALDLVPGEFWLYAGNLDRYQDLALLDQIAAEAPEFPMIIATHAHEPHTLAFARVHRIARDAARPLLHGARAFVAPRRRTGGFPIKLVNAMEASCPIVTREGQASTLAHDHNALLVPADAGVDAFVEALDALSQAPAKARALGMQARNTAAMHHDWDLIAKRTLRFVEAGLARARV